MRRNSISSMTVSGALRRTGYRFDVVGSVRAVLLDLGGVVYLPDHDRVLGALARLELSLEHDRIDEAHYHGVASIEDFRDGDRSIWQAYNCAYARVCGVATGDLERAARVLLEEFGRGGVWTRIIPGALDALRALHDLGVGLAVVSNADGTVEDQLRADGICQVGPGAGVPVDAVLDSTVVGITKPDPGIFHLALEALDVDPNEALHVGDIPGADVVGARAAGVTPVLVDPYDLHADVGCARVRSLAEVPSLVEARR
jgi:putative hydrolase of the HAD superfamily